MENLGVTEHNFVVILAGLKGHLYIKLAALHGAAPGTIKAG